jgi:hypothetical protein
MLWPDQLDVAENTVGLSCINSHYSGISIITSTFVRIAFEAQRLKVSCIVLKSFRRPKKKMQLFCDS